MLKCRDVSEQMTLYMEGALPPGRRLALRWHLWRCAMCRNYLAQLRQTIGLLCATRLPPPAPEVEQALLAARGGPAPGE